MRAGIVEFVILPGRFFSEAARHSVYPTELQIAADDFFFCRF